jgi:hypothetical protein
MKKWKYIHYDESISGVTIGNEWKEEIVWSLTSPGADYVDDTTPGDLLERELYQKINRTDYGSSLFNIVSSQLRLSRLTVDDSLSAHEATRTSTYIHFDLLQNNIKSGNFISAYEDVNNLDTSMGVTAQEIIEYRAILSSYLVSTDEYTDTFGNDIEGGMYDELRGLSLDANYFIIES